MHLKVTQTKYKEKVTSYAKIVHSYIDGKTCRQRLILNLGKIKDKSNLEEYRKILQSLQQDKEFIDLSTLSVKKCYEYGVIHVVDSLLKKYGIDEILKNNICDNNCRFDVYGILKALLINRFINPSSELSAIDWADKHYS